jgi:hypothetical protein
MQYIYFFFYYYYYYYYYYLRVTYLRSVQSTILLVCSEVEVTLQLAVSQSVCQGIEPTLGLVTRYYFLS